MFLNYCLKTQQNNWNFIEFVILAKSIGIQHVKFFNYKDIQTIKYPTKINIESKEFSAEEIAYNRFKNIVLPLCDLAGLSYEIHDNQLSFKQLIWAHPRNVAKYFRKNSYIWKFQSTPVKEDYVTVTLRNSIRNIHRNSNFAWYQFVNYCSAKKIKVKVFEDREINPISVKKRWEIYSNAKMNYGVTNGPLALCVYSDAPYKIWIKSEEERKVCKVDNDLDDEGFCFANKNQSLIWKDDTLENLIKYNFSI
jgi:hypothetical protein